MTAEPDRALTSALANLQTLLNADGYDLEVASASGSGLCLQIRSGPDACAECLVPARIMEVYVRDALKDLPVWRDTPLELRYP